jgi:RimJ/RimL family protein N-acetyltransferase
MDTIELRDVLSSDLELFFQFQLDDEANFMAAFTSKNPSDKEAFVNHWSKRLSDTTIINKTILFNGNVAGSIAKFMMDGNNEMTYWIGKEFWGKGIATKALQLFLNEIPDRPLFARTAVDNVGSSRVLEKNGFKIVGRDKGFSNARRKEVEEYIFKLD